MNIKILALFLLVIIVTYSNSNCGGNCPPGNCPTCYCGTNKNVQDIAVWCGKHTWNQ